MHRFYSAAFAPKRWNGAETALGLRRFLPNANYGETKIESGTKREGQSGFRKQDIFFGLGSPLTLLLPCFEGMKKICYCGAPVLPIAMEVENIVGLMTYEYNY